MNMASQETDGSPVLWIPRTNFVEVVQAVRMGGRVGTAYRVAGRIAAVFDDAQDVGYSTAMVRGAWRACCGPAG